LQDGNKNVKKFFDTCPDLDDAATVIFGIGKTSANQLADADGLDTFYKVLDMYLSYDCDVKEFADYLLCAELQENSIEDTVAFVDNFYKTSYKT